MIQGLLKDPAQGAGGAQVSRAAALQRYLCDHDFYFLGKSE